MKGWLLVLTLIDLALANAIVWFSAIWLITLCATY